MALSIKEMPTCCVFFLLHYSMSAYEGIAVSSLLVILAVWLPRFRGF